jgi:hypothetical protein
MTFLNALLAFGATAFTIPLIIHLLNRSKYMTIDWGAMQFLESSVKVNSRRVQWKQLLLLLVRCLIPILLALAMARPLLQAWKNSADASPVSLAILIDDSLSMYTLSQSESALQSPPANQVSGEPNRPGSSSSRILQAVAQVRTLLEGLPAGSEAALIWAGKPAQIENEHQPASLLKMKLAELIENRTKKNEIAGPTDLSEAVTLAAEWLDQGTNSKRHLLVVSDFQSSQWNSNTQDSARDFTTAFSNRSVPIHWSFLQVGSSDSENDVSSNADIALLAIDSLPSHVTPQGKMTISTTLQNYSNQNAVVPVVFMDGLDEVERQSVSVSANSTATIRFQWSPKTAGDSILKVFADWKDSTPQDHSLTNVIRAREPASILIIDGDRKQEAMQSESDFIRLALTPFSLLRGEPGDLFSTRVVTPGGWNEEALRTCEAVICCNVPDFSTDERKWLRNFVEKGGGLLMCLGDKVQADRLNAWEPLSQGGLRIGKISPRNAWEGEISLSADAPFELSRASLDALRSAQFAARHELLVEEPQVSAIATFADGLPFLTKTTIGSGKVYWMMSSGDDDDSNLPALPVYLPLVQKLMTSILHWRSGWNQVTPGESWFENLSSMTGKTNPLSSEAASLFQDRKALTVQWPAIDARDVPLNEKATDGNEPILFRTIDLGSSRFEGIAQTTFGDRRLNVSVSLPSKDRKVELARALMSADELETFAKDAKANVYRDAQSWIKQENSNPSGKEIWTWFWLGLLILFLAEMFLQQSLNPRQVRPGPSLSGAT